MVLMISLIVMSDMAPILPVVVLPIRRSFDLSMLAFKLQNAFYDQGRTFLCKIFDGEDARPS